MNFIDSWGYFVYLDKDAERYISSQDIERMKQLSSYGKVFHCIGVDGNYIVLQYRDQTYRVSPEPYKILPTPRFTFGQAVLDRNKPDRVGIIHDIHWHSKDNNHLYYLLVNNKLRSQRYYEQDLEAIVP